MPEAPQPSVAAESTSGDIAPASKISAEDALDRAIRSARTGELSQADLVRLLCNGKLAVPSRTEVVHDLSELRGILLDKQGKSFVAAFSTMQRASAMRNLAPFCLSLDTLPFFALVPAGLGVVVNPGTDVVLEITAEDVKRMVRDLAPTPDD